jgi:hypothetical protein
MLYHHTLDHTAVLRCAPSRKDTFESRAKWRTYGPRIQTSLSDHHSLHSLLLKMSTDWLYIMRRDGLLKMRDIFEEMPGDATHAEEWAVEFSKRLVRPANHSYAHHTDIVTPGKRDRGSR